jgi:hypothetical protein
MKEKKLTCNQCHRQFKDTDIKCEIVTHVCTYPDCPNYGLLQVPFELMPKEEPL